MSQSEWMTLEQTADYLDLGKSKLYELAKSDEIPCHKVGKVWKFHRAEIDAWIRSSRPIESFFTSIEYAIEDNDEIRDPQRDAHAAAVAHFAVSNEPAIIQLPVGCGKSGMIALLPLGIARGRVLVISPNVTIRDELKPQLDIQDRQRCFWRKRSVLTQETMLAGPHVALLDGKDANIHDCVKSHIVVTNIQQLASSADRWLPQFEDNFFDMILVDEGHHSAATSWKKVFERFPNAKVVNLTATPFRADQKEIKGKLIYRFGFRPAMLKGYIKRLQATYVAPTEISFTANGSAKKYSLEDVLRMKEDEWFSRSIALAPACNKDIVDASLDRLEKLRQTGTKHQLIAVGMQINHAQSIRSLYSERGYEAAIIHSRMDPDEQEDVLQKLRAGLLDVIVQVQMLGEGFDHPKLSVAAIFRPFRTLAPYLQFVGRIMRVIVQKDSLHPDNYGHIVTHAGMNVDKLLSDFKDIEHDDQKFFAALLQGEEPAPPREVLEGRGLMKIRPEMVVHNEIVDTLFEESFLDGDDDLIIEELRRQAEALGLDAEAVVKAARASRKQGPRSVPAGGAFPVNPQRERVEARKRLGEEEKRTARVLLNRVGLDAAGQEMRLKLYPALSGPNFPAAVQLVHREVNKSLNIKPGQRAGLDTPDYKRAMDLLPDILEVLVRRIKAKQAGKKDKEDKD